MPRKPNQENIRLFDYLRQNLFSILSVKEEERLDTAEIFEKLLKNEHFDKINEGIADQNSKWNEKNKTKFQQTFNNFVDNLKCRHEEKDYGVTKPAGKDGYYLYMLESESETDCENENELVEATQDLRTRNVSENDFREWLVDYLGRLDSPNRIYPIKIRHEVESGKKNKSAEEKTKWEWPDICILEWQKGVFFPGEHKLDDETLNLKSHSGQQSFRLISVELKLHCPDIRTARMDFFQCLSNSSWANEKMLVYASPIEERVQAELMRLATIHNVTIQVYKHWNGETEKKKVDAPILYQARVNDSSIDWEQFNSLVERNIDFQVVKEVVSACLEAKLHGTFDQVLNIFNKKKGDDSPGGYFSEKVLLELEQLRARDDNFVGASPLGSENDSQWTAQDNSTLNGKGRKEKRRDRRLDVHSNPSVARVDKKQGND